MKIGKRIRNVVTNHLEKLIKKYGFNEVRFVINKYFKTTKDRAKLEEEIQEKERELYKLKSRKSWIR